MGIDYLPQSYRDLPPADSNYTGPRYAPGPASKRAATPEGRIDSMIAKKMRTSSDLVRLEEYFYATMDGDTAVISYSGHVGAFQLNCWKCTPYLIQIGHFLSKVLQSEFKADMAFKCHVCKKLYMNNVEFMKHLSLHVESERAAVDTQEQELEQCKYCYKVITRRGALCALTLISAFFGACFCLGCRQKDFETTHTVRVLLIFLAGLPYAKFIRFRF